MFDINSLVYPYLNAAQVSAARDPNIFPDPDTVRLDRPLDSYIHYGEGPHTCLGKDANMVALTSMLRVVGRLENLRRAPGPQGELKKVPRPGGFYVYMRENHEGYFVFPLSKLSLSISTLLAWTAVNACVLFSDEGSFRRRAPGAPKTVAGD